MLAEIAAFLVRNIKITKSGLIALIESTDSNKDGYIDLGELIKRAKRFK